MLNTLLGENKGNPFITDIYLKTPYASAETAKPFASLLTLERFYELLAVVPENDLLVVKNGKLFPDLVPRGTQTFSSLRSQGFSIVLRNTDALDPQLGKFAQNLEEELKGSVAIQLYFTPAKYFSFGWHYDAEEVFILQTTGSKAYYLRENTVNPRPRLEEMPKDMQYEREVSPAVASLLISGDWLYIPGGWWHVARALEDSLSISIGVLPGRTSRRERRKGFPFAHAN